MTPFKLAILISGNGSNLQAIIDKFKDDNFIEISCVISNKKNAFGLKRATNANIDNYVIDHTAYQARQDFEAKIIDILESYQPDLVVLAGFMRILSEFFVNKYLGKLINIHPSLLPKYKGLDTHKKVLDNNEKYHGVTVHFVDNTLDGGPICAQSKMLVETEDIGSLEESIHKLEYDIYPRVIYDIAHGKVSLNNGKVIRTEKI